MSKKVRHGVEDLLRKYPEARDNDKLLALKYWSEVDNLPTFNSMISMDAIISFGTPFETISRARRYIQNIYDELKASPKVREQRLGREKFMRENAFIGNI